MIGSAEWKSFLEDGSPEAWKETARRASVLTRRHFGRAVSLFAPLYLSNYCDGGCVYCGFNRSRPQRRRRLSLPEMDREMEALSASGIRSVLLLTGESPAMTPIGYLLAAVARARRRFVTIALEVYPLDEDDYRRIVEAGVDGITLFQETYDRSRYRELHPAGRKADYDYRYSAPERMARAGVRSITLGVLLGLADPAGDSHALFAHLESLQRRFPGVEYRLAFPRVIPATDSAFEPVAVSERTLIRLLAGTRVLFPRVGITLSTRENAGFRDRALELGVDRISAGSRTDVGGYTESHPAAGQFAIRDDRSTEEVVAMLKQKGFDPVFSDWFPAGGMDATENQP